MPEKDYTVLVNEIALGSMEAYEKLFNELYAPLVLFAEKITKNKNKSEGIVQDIFCHIWGNRKKLPEVKYLKTYLYTSVRNKSLSYLRDIKKFSYGSEVPETESYDILSEIFENEIYSELHKVINSLPEKCKRVIKLKLKGLKDDEIASCLDISKETVKAHVKKGYREIRKELKDIIYLVSILLCDFL